MARVGPERLLNWSVSAAEQTRGHPPIITGSCARQREGNRESKGALWLLLSFAFLEHRLPADRGIAPAGQTSGPARRSHLSAVPLGRMSGRCDLDPELGGEGALCSFRNCLEWRFLMLGWEREEGNRATFFQPDAS